ncbi:MAG: PspC domain-containing protein, partial [Mycobacterium sp.]
LWELARSPRDVKLGGVCGGIAGAAEIPSWFVRVAFVVVGFVYGFGLLIYVLLWCCMPLGTVVGPGADADGGPRQG